MPTKQVLGYRVDYFAAHLSKQCEINSENNGIKKAKFHNLFDGNRYMSA